MKIRKASFEDAKEIANLAFLLWPNADKLELFEEFKETLKKDLNHIYVAEEDRLTIGFAECSIRMDYVEGTSTSPVGYLEAIFVLEAYRHQFVATELLRHCESWARQKGCKEFASDTEIENVDSIRFHKKTGFQEVNRIVCFAKKI